MVFQIKQSGYKLYIRIVLFIFFIKYPAHTQRCHKYSQNTDSMKSQCRGNISRLRQSIPKHLCYRKQTSINLIWQYNIRKHINCKKHKVRSEVQIIMKLFVAKVVKTAPHSKHIYKNKCCNTQKNRKKQFVPDCENTHYIQNSDNQR